MEDLNPWTQMPLTLYEKHMSLANVAQLQALNRLMKAQWESYPQASSAVVLGVAGGNGLEYCGDHLQEIYGIDINPDYLKNCAQRFSTMLGDRLKLIQMDLRGPQAKLSAVDLAIADLLIEYVGVPIFCQRLAQAAIPCASCVIQSSGPQQDFVSASPYQAQFQGIGELHRDVDEMELTAEFEKFHYALIYRDVVELPNGKRFVRLDYSRAERGRKTETCNYTK